VVLVKLDVEGYELYALQVRGWGLRRRVC